jgi:putative phage-type endonuclease
MDIQMLQMLKSQIDDLQSIVDEFVISENEKKQLADSAYELVYETITADPMLYISPTFHESISIQVCDLLKNQLEGAFNSDIFSDYVNDIIENSVENALQSFYKEVAPARSFKDTHTCTGTESITTQTIEYLRNVPQPAQRTKEWYAFRQSVLTASNIWKLFSTPSTMNQLIYEKCSPEKTISQNYTNTSSPMHWGQRFEPVSVAYYENTYNTKVADFGCIPHKSIRCLAASPDGIVITKDTGRYGRMLEVKNIVNRVIDGIPKLEYWIQMQVQMEVCDLNECDFLETRFTEYENEEAFNADFSVSSLHKGVIMYFNNNGNPLYEYSIWGSKRDDIETWENEMNEKHKHLELVQCIYWKLEEVSCVLVMRNPLWFNAAKPIIERSWETIVKEKENGEYIKRAPKRKAAAASSSVQSTNCLINMDLFADEPQMETQPEPEPEPELEPVMDVEIV